MKKAVPVRMPEWPEAHFPTTKETYLLFWEHHRKPLEPDPGAGLYQKSFWLDPEDLDVDAYEAECFRGERSSSFHSPDNCHLSQRNTGSARCF
jgi:hypothetical protein